MSDEGPSVGDDGVYEVDRVVDVMWTTESEDEVPQYRVRWKGFPPIEDTWEPLDNFTRDTRKTVRKFVRSYTRMQTQIREADEQSSGGDGTLCRHVNILSREVVRISSMRCDRTREPPLWFYLVVWRGELVEDATWESEVYLRHASNLVQQYRDSRSLATLEDSKLGSGTPTPSKGSPRLFLDGPSPRVQKEKLKFVDNLIDDNIRMETTKSQDCVVKKAKDNSSKVHKFDQDIIDSSRTKRPKETNSQTCDLPRSPADTGDKDDKGQSPADTGDKDGKSQRKHSPSSVSSTDTSGSRREGKKSKEKFRRIILESDTSDSEKDDLGTYKNKFIKDEKAEIKKRRALLMSERKIPKSGTEHKKLNKKHNSKNDIYSARPFNEKEDVGDLQIQSHFTNKSTDLSNELYKKSPNDSSSECRRTVASTSKGAVASASKCAVSSSTKGAVASSTKGVIASTSKGAVASASKCAVASSTKGAVASTSKGAVASRSKGAVTSTSTSKGAVASTSKGAVASTSKGAVASTSKGAVASTNKEWKKERFRIKDPSRDKCLRQRFGDIFGIDTDSEDLTLSPESYCSSVEKTRSNDIDSDTESLYFHDSKDRSKKLSAKPGNEQSHLLINDDNVIHCDATEQSGDLKKYGSYGHGKPTSAKLLEKPVRKAEDHSSVKSSRPKTSTASNSHKLSHQDKTSTESDIKTCGSSMFAKSSILIDLDESSEKKSFDSDDIGCEVSFLEDLPEYDHLEAIRTFERFESEKVGQFTEEDFLEAINEGDYTSLLRYLESPQPLPALPYHAALLDAVRTHRGGVAQLLVAPGWKTTSPLLRDEEWGVVVEEAARQGDLCLLMVLAELFSSHHSYTPPSADIVAHPAGGGGKSDLDFAVLQQTALAAAACSSHSHVVAALQTVIRFGRPVEWSR